LPISYLYVKIRWRPYECNTCSNEESIKFNKGVSIIRNFNLMDIYIYKQKHGSHINTFKKGITNDSFTTIYFSFFGENSLHWKTLYIGKLLRWKKNMKNC